MAYLVPAEAAYFNSFGQEAGKSRLYAGVEYRFDYAAGLELGRRVAQQVIAKARADGSDAVERRGSLGALYVDRNQARQHHRRRMEAAAAEFAV